MARSSSRRTRARARSGPERGALEAAVRRAVARAAADAPLPTTRELGAAHGVANTTAFRLLQRLARAGEVWQHPANGRFYPAAARALLDRPKPVACAIRRLEVASELYREFLEGISAGCGAQGRAMLLGHDELLVNHPDPAAPPEFAPPKEQRAVLGEFLERHGPAAGGFVLDHVWSDDALRAHRARLRSAVLLFRTCAVAGIGNVRADFRSGALQALVHLLGHGYETIVPVVPFAGDPAIAEFGAALGAAAAELGCRARVAPAAQAGTVRERRVLLERLRRGATRTALICPEDNVALLLLAGLRDAGLRCPQRIGVLSAMGTDFARRAEISRLACDFRAMGRRAVELLAAGAPATAVFEPRFCPGATT